MFKRKPCEWCGGPKPGGIGRRVCGSCKLVDLVWDRLVTSVGGCWLWTGGINKGYGWVGESDQPHRLVYEELIGEIPEGLHLDHLCRVPTCCNPWHLDPVTPGENSRRKWAVYNRCTRGHEFTAENTRTAKGIRHCRRCEAIRSREYRRRKVAS